MRIWYVVRYLEAVTWCVFAALGGLIREENHNIRNSVVANGTMICDVVTGREYGIFWDYLIQATGIFEPGMLRVFKDRGVEEWGTTRARR